MIFCLLQCGSNVIIKCDEQSGTMSSSTHAGEEISLSPTTESNTTSKQQEQEQSDNEGANSHWVVEVQKGDQIVQEIKLPQPADTAESITLGRKGDVSDIVLNHESISRCHARVLVLPSMAKSQGKQHASPPQVMLKDLKARNGTFVNGVQLKSDQTKTLQEGDYFQLGESSRRYVLARKSVDPSKAVEPGRVNENVNSTEQTKTSSDNTNDRHSVQDSTEDVDMNPEKLGLPGAFGATSGKAGTKAVSGIAEEYREAKAFQYTDNEDASIEFPNDEEDVQEDGNKEQGGSDVLGNSTEKIQLARKHGVPVVRCAVLRGHERTVSAIGLDRAGARVITGSLDHHLKLYDFGGMDAEHRPFKDICPEEGNVIKAVDFSPTGDSFIVATGSRQPQIYDRDGNWQLTFVKGNQYLMNLRNTRGHIGEVTHAEWHPSDRNITLTSAIEGTVRWWDLNGEIAFDGELFCEHVVRLKDDKGLWTGASTCGFAPSGYLAVAGGFDGSIQMFDKRTSCIRPSKVIRDAHGKQEHAVTSLDFQPNASGSSFTFASRGLDGMVKVWDMRKAKSPLTTIENVPTLLHSANVCWSPDGKFMALGNSAGRNKGDGYFVLLDFAKCQQHHKRVDLNQVWGKNSDAYHNECVLLHAKACDNDSLPVVKWHPQINQLFLGSSDATTRVLFDEEVSNKGALLSSKKKIKSKLDTIDMAAPIIMSGERPRRIRPKDRVPGVVNYDEETGRRMWHSLRRDPIVSKKPEQPSTEMGDGELHIGSRTHLQHAMKEQHKNKLVEEDPRERLLQYEPLAKKSKLVGSAYEKTQPQAQYESKTLEEEYGDEDEDNKS
eukprot:gb/GECG01016634.1/.p1 GENE.gb/GECG01016634.1/~~gb/GECG01016634.1/.p1  ORF type:complete len:833 (+),score=127.50 gb/GECG01016634.1/:1-2499(+)